MEGHDDQQHQGTGNHTLNAGKNWDDTSTTTIHDAVEEDDVTLAMTMQITLTQSLDVYALDHLLYVAESTWAFGCHHYIFNISPVKRFQNDNFAEISHKDNILSSRV
eukprot:6636089-Ditylum_brightwellii.AAC.1